MTSNDYLAMMNVGLHIFRLPMGQLCVPALHRGTSRIDAKVFDCIQEILPAVNRQMATTTCVKCRTAWPGVRAYVEMRLDGMPYLVQTAQADTENYRLLKRKRR